jgi:hypothetical protein
VKKTHPEMQLCSNWAFSDHMPEAVCAPVDWISGDLTPEDSVNSARFSARYLAHQGKPWDLMSWSFTIHGQRRNGSNQKSAVQLEREAALVLAQGGGFASYYGQRRDGSVSLEHLPVIAEVAKFCRARQPFCQGAVPVPQIALLYSTASHYREMNGLFPRDLSRLSGTLQALVEGQQVVDVVSEHHLAGRMSQYPLILVAECDYLEPAFKDELLAYARGGGRLLVIGPQAASLFKAELGFSFANARPERRFLAWGGSWVMVETSPQEGALDARVSTFGEMHLTNDTASASQPAATMMHFGSGILAAVWFPLSRGYLADRSPQLRSFLNELVRQLFPDPMVRVSGNPDIDVCVNRLAGKLAINLINASDRHWDRDKPLFDVIAPVGPLQITVHSERSPSRVRLEPGNATLPFEYRDGVVQLAVPEVEIHRVVLVE